MRTQEFSECCFLPVFYSGDGKYQRQTRCGGCGCICNVIAQKDMSGCDELLLTDIPVVYDYAFAEPNITRVDFTRHREYEVGEHKMKDTIGNDI